MGRSGGEARAALGVVAGCKGGKYVLAAEPSSAKFGCRGRRLSRSCSIVVLGAVAYQRSIEPRVDLDGHVYVKNLS